jgi:lysozyme
MSRDRVLIAAAAAGFAMAGALLAKWEGTKYEAYLDTGNVPTICYGHTKGVKLGDVATEAQCKQWLAEDMAEAEAIVNKYVKVPLNASRKAATISFVFNVGETQFVRSTYLRKLNQGDYAGACLELKRWVYDNGVYIRGLAHRRDDEFRLCTKIDFSLVYSGVTFTQH